MKIFATFIISVFIIFSNSTAFADPRSNGDLVGTVACNGVAVALATVEIEGIQSVQTDANGYYEILDLIPQDYMVHCYKDGVNFVDTTASITSSNQTVLDISLCPPDMVVIPSFIDVTMNPNEYAQYSINILNNGDGDLHWTASDNASWLTLSDSLGDVPANGGTQTITANLNALGTQSGEVYNADIVINAEPNGTQITIPVTMTIDGDPFGYFSFFSVDLVNDITGVVVINWIFESGSGGGTVEYFLIFRNGFPIGNSTGNIYTDHVPNHGDYCYSVRAIFTQNGNSSTNTECISWGAPEMVVTDQNLYGEVWPDHSVHMNTTIQNVGISPLAYEFPNYVSSNRFTCDYQLELFDDYGDGWNNGTLDLFLNGVLTIDDITLNNGSGPEYVSFNAEDGDEITTIWTSGDYPYEASYNVLDCNGDVVYTDGANGTTPAGIPAGALYAVVAAPNFITVVYPTDGFISPGGEADIFPITYDATGFPPGTYTQWLYINSNDPNKPYDSIFNTMLVYEPALIYGWISDCNSGDPIPNATVSAGFYSVETNASGYFELLCDEGTYDVEVDKTGYDPTIYSGINAIVSVPYLLMGTLCLSPDPVGWVYADPNEADTECLVTWSVPMGATEIIYEDGTAEDYFVWALPGGQSAVRFTPETYPATVVGGRIYVGDESLFPGVHFLNTEFVAMVLDDDGTNGLPGTVLDSITLTINNFGWIDFFGEFDVEVTEGDFYLSIMQLNNPQQANPVGVDTVSPTANRSYTKEVGLNWETSPYQDFMIRAYVSGPTQNQLVDYTVAMVDGFNPSIGETPADGNLNMLGNTTDQSWNDLLFGSYEPYYYAYAVQANYNGFVSSEWKYSNIVGHEIDLVATIYIEMCDGSSPEGAVVGLINPTNYPFVSHIDTCGPEGVVIFDSVINGTYDLLIQRVGYVDFFIPGIWMIYTYTFTYTLQEIPYPPRNLEVDPLTAIATWDPPVITQMETETFENGTFPPTGWQSYTYGMGWFRTDDGSSGSFTIPPGDGYYACTIDDHTSSNDGSMDYLITPALDLRESDSFKLVFDHYYTGASGQYAYVEYSDDNGATWTQIAAMNAVAEWTEVEISLAAYSGADAPGEAWIAFHADDGQQDASGWAVDNVGVHNGPAACLGYRVFLAGQFIASVPADVTSYACGGLQYGETYTLCLKSTYSCGQSEYVCDTWVSTYLDPPRHLTDTYTPATDSVPLLWNPPVTVMGEIPPGLSHFELYRDGVHLAYIPYDGQAPDEWITYTDTDMMVGTYAYDVSAWYDLTDYGYPGQEGESMLEGTVVVVLWGFVMPFDEDWSQGTFETNNWTVSDENWVINTAVGNDAPSAEFTWDPLMQHGYSSTLTSYPIDGSMLSDGEVWLDFDIGLEYRNPTGLEKLLVEVYDGTAWNEVASFSNDGRRTVEWDESHIDIAEYALGHFYQIRFNVVGENSFDIISWFIDNIEIYRTCEAPTAFSGTYDGDGANNNGLDFGSLLSWEAPDVPYAIAEWIHWCDDELVSGIGMVDGHTFSVAARWDAAQLTDYEGTAITKVQFAPNDDGAEEIIVKIWTGANAENLVFEESVTAIAGAWNTLEITTPITLNVNEALWVGYTLVETAVGSYPAGTDAGPAVAGYGDMITSDGSSWDALSGFGLDYNWCIQVYVEELEVVSPPPVILEETSAYNDTDAEWVRSPLLIAPVSVINTSRNLNGFNIFRMGPGESDYTFLETVAFEYGISNYSYYDEDPYPGMYPYDVYYRLNAVFGSDTDYCESPWALDASFPSNDFVHILITDIGLNRAEALIRLYPNPTSDLVYITSTQPMTHIRLTNYVGQVMYEADLDGIKATDLHTSSFNAGVYIIQLDTENASVTKRLAISR